MQTHLSAPDRTSSLLAVALLLAAQDGWRDLTRDALARTAGVSPALVSERLGTMDALRRSLMRAAVKQRVVSIVAEGLLARHPQALKADAALRAECAAWMVR